MRRNLFDLVKIVIYFNYLDFRLKNNDSKITRLIGNDLYFYVVFLISFKQVPSTMYFLQLSQSFWREWLLQMHLSTSATLSYKKTCLRVFISTECFGQTPHKIVSQS